MLTTPVELALFRAPVDNDGFKLMPELSRRIGVGGTAWVGWEDAGLHRRPATDFAEHEHWIDVLVDGSELHHHRVVVPDTLTDVARVGVTFRLPAGFDNVRWYGRGPGENYPDRNRGSLLGVRTAPVDEPPYLVPQEFGLRTDCRWFEMVGDGLSLRVEAFDPGSLHCSATHFTQADLLAAAHETDLVPRDELVVHLDVAHRGVGTASCGPDILDRYRVSPGTYVFSYRIVVTAP